MNNRDLISLAPQELINAALDIDAAVLSTRPKVFKAENRINYDLAINTWLLVVRDYAPYSWTSVASRIRQYGLADTVSHFGKSASAFLASGDCDEYTLPSLIYKEIVRNFQLKTLNTSVYLSSQSPQGIFLFICRYLKRFTPLWADKLDEEATRAFLSNQNRLKMLCRRGYSEFILDLVRSEVDDPTLRQRARAYSNIHMNDIEITPGTCFSLSGDRLRTLYEKYGSLDREYKYFTSSVYSDSVWKYTLGHTARLMTVPKTFSSARTIAPEECLRQAIAHRMFSLRVRTPEGIDLEDQTVNQRFAQAGSQTGAWCTIDLSHASDDVTWSLVQDIYRYNPYYIKYLSLIRPSTIVVNGKEYLLQSFATMGNSMTFLVESEIFWLITRAAVHFAQRHGVLCADTVVVYGDDIICASDAYPFVVAFLTKLGFSINENKSYYTGPFRESCGKDYLYGEDVSSPYFPRKPLKTLMTWDRNQNSELITTAESIISLQHRLYDVSPNAAQYIELYIREHKPALGIEPSGTSTPDLWGLDVIPYGRRYIPEWIAEESIDEYEWKLVDGRWRYVKKQHTYVKTLVEDSDHCVQYQLRPAVEVAIQELPEELLYLMYLDKGPWYRSSLDELLGISVSRRLMPTGAPHSVWKKFER